MRTNLMLLGFILLLTSCSSKTKNPYLDDPEIAKNKLETCHTELAAATQSQDTERVQAIADDEECRLASEAHQAHVSTGKISPLQPKQPNPARRMNNATEPVTPNVEPKVSPLAVSSSIDPEYYKAMPFEEYYLWSKRCLSSIVDRRTKKCEVVRSLMDDRYKVEIDKVRNRFAGKPEKLKEFSRSVCVGEETIDYLCEFSLQIMKEE